MIVLLFLLIISPVQSFENQPIKTMTCDGCRIVVDAVEHWVASNTTEQVIIHNVNKLCELLPKYSNVCTTLISVGIPKIISDIILFENSLVVCTQLSLCGLDCGDMLTCKIN